jgi:hypothetical protein
MQAAAATSDAWTREPIDALEVFEHIRDITDPEHPYTLEQLNVVDESLITIDDTKGRARYAAAVQQVSGVHADCLAASTRACVILSHGCRGALEDVTSVTLPDCEALASRH